MGAPLAVNTNAEVEINDSCNCCFPFRRRKHKHHHVQKKVNDVYQEKIPQPKPPVKMTKSVKKIHSEPTLLMTNGEWVFEEKQKPGFQGYE